MDPEASLNQLQSRQPHESGDKPGKEHLDIRNIKDRFLNALKEVSRLERVIEGKNTQLAIAAREKESLIRSLDKSFENEKKLHDKLAEFDILRNIELSEVRQEVEKLADEKNMLAEKISEHKSAIGRLNAERDELNIRLAEMAVEIGSLKEKNSEIRELKEAEPLYKKMEVDFRAAEKERDDLKKKISALAFDLNRKIEAEAEYTGKIEEFRMLIEELNAKIDEKINETSSLKLMLDGKEKAVSGIASENTSLKEALGRKDIEIENLRSEYEDRIKRLEEETKRLTYDLSSKEQIIREHEEKIEKSGAGQREDAEGKDMPAPKETRMDIRPSEEITDINLPEKMIYVESFRHGGIKNIAIIILALAVIGIAIYIFAR